MNTANDIRLVEACKQGSRQAQKQLYGLFLPYIKSLVRRYLIDQSYNKDVTQEIFIKIFTRIQSFDSNKGTLKAWMARLAINTVYDVNKKNKTQQLFDNIDEVAPQIRISEDLFLKYTKEELNRFLDKMPTKFKTVFNMAVIDELSHDEIAKILGVSAAVSRKRLSRARAWLKERFLKQTGNTNGLSMSNILLHFKCI